jgi:hypothetical protein
LNTSYGFNAFRFAMTVISTKEAKGSFNEASAMPDASQGTTY